MRDACSRYGYTEEEDFWEKCDGYKIEFHKFKYSVDERGPKIRKLTNKLPEIEGIFEAGSMYGPPALLQNLYVTFKKFRDEEISKEFEKCLVQLKSNIEKKDSVGCSNLGGCKCKIKKDVNKYTFIVEKVPFAKLEIDPKQKHHAENNLNHIFWERLWSVMLTDNNVSRDWLRAHLNVSSYEWKDSKIEDLIKKLPEVEGIFD
jgi:hypothetical protein